MKFDRSIDLTALEILVFRTRKFPVETTDIWNQYTKLLLINEIWSMKYTVCNFQMVGT